MKKETEIDIYKNLLLSDIEQMPENVKTSILSEVKTVQHSKKKKVAPTVPIGTFLIVAIGFSFICMMLQLQPDSESIIAGTFVALLPLALLLFNKIKQLKTNTL